MFTGIGGFELGIEQATDGEWECIGYSEIDKYSIETFEKHYPEIKNYGDATKIDADGLPDFDLLCGGFPCQAFSIAGKRGGFDDTRGTLFFDVARVIKAKRPKALLLENVKGLLSHEKGETFRTIIQTLDELGYEVQWMVLNSKFHGVPQNRERVFIIGSLRGSSRPEILPLGESDKGDVDKNQTSATITSSYKKGVRNEFVKVHNMQPRNPNRPSLVKICPCGSKKLFQACCGTPAGSGHLSRDNISYCLDGSNVSNAVEFKEKEIRKDDISPCLATRKHSTTDPSTMPNLVINKAIRRSGDLGKQKIYTSDIMGTLCANPSSDGVPMIGAARKAQRNIPKAERSYDEQQLEIRKDGVSNTVTSVEKDNYGVGSSIRRLTPTECERLQGFPDNWTEGVSDTQRYKQCGNAVTVNVIKALIHKFINV